jgi:endonuclease/exonuclease/phosphatase family metal-dependent hydrolase
LENNSPYELISGSKVRFKVMVYNLENFFVFMDKYQDEDISTMDEFAWQHLGAGLLNNKALDKVKKIKILIEHHSPDILMLTEVGGKESLDNFNKYFLNDEYKVIHRDSNSDRGIDMGYLIKKSHAKMIDVKSYSKRPLYFLYPHELKRHKKVTFKNSQRFSRDALQVKLKINEQTVVFLLVHLKSKLDKNGIDREGSLRREAELKTLLDIYKEQKSEMVIIGGDFNGFAQKEETDQEFKQIYKKTQLEDVLELGSVKQDSRFTYVHQNRATKQLFATQLDYLFVDKKYKSNLISSSVDHYELFLNTAPTKELLKNQRDKLPSDHFPVIAEFEI